MLATLASLVDRFDRLISTKTGVIDWSCPVPSFGDPSRSRIATLGINPSNREFVDENGEELAGSRRRFHTLHSLSLRSWADADCRHLRLIDRTCREYFQRNPYDRWFKRLDGIVIGAGASYYDELSSACHLDVIPYATREKWTNLAPTQKAALLGIGGDALGSLLRESAIGVLILNGRAVVNYVERLTQTPLAAVEKAAWSLSRGSRAKVIGIAYKGWIDSIGGVNLDRRVLALGFNHNIQSSFGVTRETVHAIRCWVAEAIEEANCETEG